MRTFEKESREMGAGESLGSEGEDHFRRLFEGNFQSVCNQFAARGISVEDSLDLAQETFFRAYRGFEHFRREASAKTWLFSIARNVWLSSLRNRSAGKRDGLKVPLDEAVQPMPAAGSKSAKAGLDSNAEPLEMVLQQERVDKLRQALEALPPQMRQCVMLRLFQGLKYREIAAVMRISEQTVKTHIFQAKRRLTALLEEYSTEIEL